MFFFLKINRKGDYYRYLAEFANGDERKKASDSAQEAYKLATDEAGRELPTTRHTHAGTEWPSGSRIEHVPGDSGRLVVVDGLRGEGTGGLALGVI